MLRTASALKRIEVRWAPQNAVKSEFFPLLTFKQIITRHMMRLQRSVHEKLS